MRCEGYDGYGDTRLTLECRGRVVQLAAELLHRLAMVIANRLQPLDCLFVLAIIFFLEFPELVFREFIGVLCTQSQVRKHGSE